MTVYATIEVSPGSGRVRAYPAQPTLLAAVEHYVDVHRLWQPPTVRRVDAGHGSAWFLEHDGADQDVCVVVTELAEAVLTPGTDHLAGGGQGPSPQARPRGRRQVVRLCEVCRRECHHLGPSAGAGGQRRQRWVCPEHGPRPSPVLHRP